MPPASSVSPMTKATPMDWPSAMRSVIAGKKITRRGIDGCIFLSGGFLSIRKDVDGSLHHLLTSADDLHAEDWTVVREV